MKLTSRWQKLLANTFTITAIGTLAACSGDGRNNNRAPIGDTELTSRQLSVNLPLEAVSFAGGNTLSLNVAVGSGAFHLPSDSIKVFYTVTDRGPTFDCAEAGTIAGNANLCNGASGTVFAIPDYAPRIIQWQLEGRGADLSLTPTDTIILKDDFSNPLVGLPNDYQQTTTDNAFGPDGLPLIKDANGIDPEAIVKLNNGRYWLAEEYGPSLLLVDSDGTVLQRQVPAGLASELGFSTLDVREDIIPAIFSRRKLGRGVEALAVSPENDFLYFVMQSPLRNPDDNAFENSRNIRIGKVSLNDDGTPDALVGEYIYRLDAPAQFGFKHDNSGDLPGGEYVAQSAITINEAAAVAEDDLLLVEQAEVASKIYRINLANAVSIQGGEFDSFGTSPSLEERTVIADVPFVVKQLVYDSASAILPVGVSPLPRQFEGLALMNSNFAVLTHDNDYGLRGAQTAQMTVLPITSLLSGRPSPVAPFLDYANSARFHAGAGFDSKAVQGVAADPINDRLFTVNNQAGVVDIVDVSDPLSPSGDGELNIGQAAAAAGIGLGRIGGIALRGDFLAVSIGNSQAQQNGAVAVYDLDTLSLEATFAVGAAPKGLSFDQTGVRLVVANEGLPSSDYGFDPVGSVSLIDLGNGVANASTTTLGFVDFNSGGSRATELPAGVLITGPGASVAQDLEPEQVIVDLNNNAAYVSLQENNAVAVVDLENDRITRIVALGSKDFGIAGQGLDANDNGVADIRTRPGVVGLYQPSGIESYRFANTSYFVTVNEGAPRSYGGFNEVVRAQDLDGFNGPNIDGANPSAAAAANSFDLGRLNVSRVTGDTDNDGDIDAISAFGGRSFSIRDAQGRLIYDSGDEFAQITRAVLGANFNDSDTASDDSGSRPKAVTLAGSGGRVYAFITLQASGGVMVYDVTSPFGVQFVQYLNNRDFAINPQSDSGDVGPSSVTLFNNGTASYLAVGNERSGSVRIFEVAPDRSSD